MDDSDALLTIAEIAATFAGFAALVSVLGRRVRSGRAIHDLLRLRLVIATSLIVVVASLVPSALARFGLPMTQVWQIAAGVFLALIYIEFVSFFATYNPVREDFDPDLVAAGVSGALQLLVQAGLLIVLFGWMEALDDALYVGALVAMLCTSAFVFMRLVESTFSQIVGKE